ncbi:hypothetical protein P691DRAFT_304759 [Macrolepiota fuliginosa MF-IS2]|uniref:Uncharacterized protein n=1 Tax=Macrolepiota fuliginosa MF-IS2 TaxID=1400762 RepID=A0A9P5X5F6_9AGAR|nr:hypothetical protein P691DRAFT_304759 [Macrolepiota fuliginosa MF-IS2]
MFSIPPDYVLASQFSHFVALVYSLWAFFGTPRGKARRVDEVQWALVLMSLNLGTLVLVDGMISRGSHLGQISSTTWFRLRDLLAVTTLFFVCYFIVGPRVSSRGQWSSLVAITLTWLCTLALGSAVLDVAWKTLVWLVGHIPTPGHRGPASAWDNVFEKISLVPCEVLPLVLMLRSVRSDAKVCQQLAQNRAPFSVEYGSVSGDGVVHWNGPALPALESYDVMLLCLAIFFACLSAPLQDIPWESKGAFGEGVVVVCSTMLVIVTMRCYFRLINLVRASDALLV